VTAKERLTNKSHKTISRIFCVFGPGDLRTVSLEDFFPSATPKKIHEKKVLCDPGPEMHYLKQGRGFLKTTDYVQNNSTL
jgi:hypothetical protein